uniref:Immunoglobulin heavy diversity 1-1 n=1 Tax=Homo sapiens TaxID=9606 RepID=HD101_HUMAN
GTTGT